jgi:hypothetical protein
MRRDARSLHLGGHTAAADVGAGLAGHLLHVVGDRRYERDMLRLRIGRRIGRVEAIHVGKQDQRIRHDQLRNPRRQPVVVAVTDFFCRHRIVLVDHGHDAPFDQAPERAARVKEAAPVLRVFGGEQDLCRGDPEFVERFLVGMHQLHLARRRRGLQIF